MVAVGGVVGVLARFGLSKLSFHHDTLIWTTVGINVVASFLLGLLVAELGRAALYLAASVLGGIAAAALGFGLGRVLR